MSATKTIEIQKILTRKFTEEESARILDYVENQGGNLATKQDIGEVKGDIGEVKGDIGEVKGHIGRLEGHIGEVKGHIGRLEGYIKRVEDKVNLLKWVVGLVMTLGFGTLLTMMLYLHSSTQDETNRRFAEQKVEINRRFAEVDRRLEKLETDIKEIKALLLKGKR